MEFDYYYGSQADQFNFIRIPKVMLVDKAFSVLSLPAKLLYGLLLDRMCLSMKNGWVDNSKRVYIIYQVSEIQEDLGITKRKAIDYLAELENFGLLEKKRRGLGLASILYVKSFISKEDSVTSISAENDSSEKEKNGKKSNYEEIELTKTVTSNAEENMFCLKKDTRSADSVTSESTDMLLQEVCEKNLLEVFNPEPLNNNTNINNNYVSYTSNQIISKSGEEEMRQLSEYVRGKIELDILLERNPFDRELIRGIYDLILETLMATGDSIHIACNIYPASLVKSKFMKIDSSNVEYVLDCFKGNSTKVKNIKKYILASLFNSTSTMSSYYQAEVNHDFPQYARHGRQV